MLVHGPVVGFPLAPGNQPEQPVAPDHLVGVADEGLQQLKLGGGQVDCFAARRKQRPLGQIEAPASKAHHRRHGGGPFRAELGAPQHAAHAGEQLARMKRLGDIVIRADLKTDSAVDRVSLAREDHHRDVRPLAQESCQAEAALPRHGDVDQREIDPLAALMFACDPVQEILDVCRETGVPAQLARSDFVPERLPFEEHFDLVFAFSVFTHLSEAAHEACLGAIHDSLARDGLLILTVRPPAYLAQCEAMHPLLRSLGPDPLAKLAEPRYLFVPHPAEPDHPQFHSEEMTFGETVITLPYVRERWAPAFELLDVSLLTEDIHQVVLTLRKRD